MELAAIEVPGTLHRDLYSMTADIVSSFVASNPCEAAALPALIRDVHNTLADLGPKAEPEPEALTPAVSIRASVKPDHIVCLEDGKKLKMLKRYLMTRYGMTPEQYRERWNLPADYPMVAPSYADKRCELAMKHGLGRKPGKA